MSREQMNWLLRKKWEKVDKNNKAEICLYNEYARELKKKVEK